MPSKKAVGCPLEVTLHIIDGRWKVMVIHELVDGVRRFGEPRGGVPPDAHPASFAARIE